MSASNCTRRDCAWEHGINNYQPIHAGRISATAGDRKVFVDPSDSGYPAKFDKLRLWEGENVVTIQAEGGEVPGFAVELVGPYEAVIAEPPPPALDSKLSVTRDAPFAVVWHESNIGQTMAVLSYQDGTDYSTITCNFDATSSSGIIPTELLADFNPNNVQMRLSIGTGQSQIVDAGGWLVEVIAYVGATTNDARDASYSVKFE